MNVESRKVAGRRTLTAASEYLRAQVDGVNLRMGTDTNDDAISDTNVDVAKGTATNHHVGVLVQRIYLTCIDDNVTKKALVLKQLKHKSVTYSSTLWVPAIFTVFSETKMTLVFHV